MGDKHLKKQKAAGSGRLLAPTPPQSTNGLSPVFCLRYLAKGYGLSECDGEQAASFVTKLGALCKLDWDTIAKSAREGMGHEKMPVSQIRGQLPSRVTDDVKELLVFRFAGEGPARILGLRSHRVFEVYMIDPKGSAYDH